VRAASGAITTFEAPGALALNTFATSINTAGTVAGVYLDAVGVNHGLVRAASGAITTFNAPCAGAGYRLGTYAESINETGDIAGYCPSAASFLRSASGDIVTFEAPDYGTFAVSINGAAAIAGYFMDSGTPFHGFVRTP
jgi:hypothetical protein